MDDVATQQKAGATGKFVEDVNYVTVRHLLLSNVLTAVGITPAMELIKPFYTHDDLTDFINWADNCRGLLSAIWPKMPSLKKMNDNPYRFVGGLLDSIGISQKRVKGKDEGVSVCTGYAINKISLEKLKMFV